MLNVIYSFFLCACLCIVSTKSAADENNNRDSALPITTLDTPAAKKLKAWYEAGTAAGNHGDFYDNRDRTHSQLNLQHYPQLSQLRYSESEIKENADYGAQQKIAPGVVFGNSSTASGVHRGGSNTRRYYTRTVGLDLLHRLYRANNLYVYPEHRDHDSGHNGSPGFGDLFPTNTPYLITSQGSSGSDQPFLRALPLVLAAFRPKVKKRLVSNGLLMPTVQMILRTHYPKSISSNSYLSATGHPSVFDGKQIHPLPMVKMAHEITPDAIPPLVRLQVLNETSAFRGKDYFDPQPSEIIANTPSVVARIFRGAAYKRRMRVSAEDSFDLNNRQLTFHWVVLRGDKSSVRITPQNENQSVAEIEVRYTPRVQIHNTSIASNRIDIGVFAHNGKYYSAPAFITWFSLDHESRVYANDGRVLEIAYGLGNVQSQIKDWAALVNLVSSDQQSFAARLIKQSLPEKQQRKLISFKQEIEHFEIALREAETNLATTTDESKNELRKRRNNARNQLNEFLGAMRSKLGGKSIEEIFNNTLSQLWNNPELIFRHQNDFEQLIQSVELNKQRIVLKARNQLLDYGLAKQQDANTKQLSLGYSSDELTEFARNQITHFNSVLLNELVFTDVASFDFKINYVDPHLSLRKQWRDVYQYNKNKQLLGWTRYETGRRTKFNRDGLVKLESDQLGRCIRCRMVSYEFIDDEKQRRYPDWAPVQHVPGNQIWTYQYADENDFRGRVVKRDNIGG